MKSRERHDEGGSSQTSGQRRAAAELDRIRREQNRTAEPTAEERANVPSRQPSSVSSRRPSNSSTATANTEGECSLEETLERMKAVLRQHERRIRMLEVSGLKFVKFTLYFPGIYCREPNVEYLWILNDCFDFYLFLKICK